MPRRVSEGTTRFFADSGRGGPSREHRPRQAEPGAWAGGPDDDPLSPVRAIGRPGTMWASDQGVATRIAGHPYQLVRMARMPPWFL